MLYKRREIFKRLEVNIAKFFSMFGLTPNMWSSLSLLFILLTFYFLLKKSFLIALIFFSIASFIDVIDGAVARYRKMVTKKGAYIDTIIDRFVEFIVILGLFFVDYPKFILDSKVWLITLLFGSMMTTYVKASAFEKKIVKKEIKGGILERAERLILIFLIILLSNFSLEYACYLIALTAFLSIVSVFQRISIVFEYLD
ncbi:MAG: CDP-alcohol phosphatidyltransferase family protein [Candidatus Parvarchaeota archaeon]|nr:CDP-alcohol phosphatidyltransferase family protein [Candidatus Jingweiarchaeum tengchongense]MCW1300305.1 CDP-alcohol phosphatidyltransferase family protein [Candidatus Jingweiarchaeum tengchongense]MCW1304899.1 CDP-alcohol phosphatidyltransferase family protein [Candidatus Jingweiarchaeum tengchongense]MCW1305801.1 CDP-alcohol phosphatidyltransferase family protein [Candidatus Jingweiarchaeum tengchongense]MCW1310803.1 CDP-alcohol phosphatidyltransferase family protein [Candidatus Jingweiar